MGIEYSIDNERKVIFETWRGEVTADDLANYWRQILIDPAALEIRRTLVDLRNCDISFTGDELAGMVRAIAVPMLGSRDWKSALLIDQAVHFGVSRQYQVFAETYSKDAIFDDPHAALRWLLA